VRLAFGESDLWKPEEGSFDPRNGDESESRERDRLFFILMKGIEGTIAQWIIALGCGVQRRLRDR